MKCDFWRGSGSHCERHDGTWNNFFGYSWRRLYPANNPLDISTDFTSLHYVFPAFRLAEVYFNYAECCIELGEYDEAVKYINTALCIVEIYLSKTECREYIVE